MGGRRHRARSGSCRTCQEAYGRPFAQSPEPKQRQLLATLETADTEARIDWNGTPFTFALFTWEFVQHEAIHHGHWSVYASLAGFERPLSWRTSRGL